MAKARIRASAIIIQNDKVLLIHRKKEGEEYWVFPGGGVEEGETNDEAIIREVKEETGLKTVVCEYGFDYEDEYSIKHPVFYCQVEDGDPVLGGPEAEKISEDDWYHPEWVELKKAVKLAVYPDVALDVLESLAS